MRNLIFSLAAFVTIITCQIFLFSNAAANASTNTTQQNLAVKPTSMGIPIENALNEEKKAPKAVEMLTQGEWKIQSIRSNKPCDTNYDGVYTTDAMSEMPVCALDDIVKFYSDGIVAFQRHERCELTEEDVEKYNWFYTEKDGKLNIARGNIDAVMIVRSLSAKQFIVDISMQDGGENHVFTVTYQRPSASQPLTAMR